MDYTVDHHSLSMNKLSSLGFDISVARRPFGVFDDFDGDSKWDISN